MNANDQLQEFNCSDNYYRYNFGLIITDGVKALAERMGAFWLIDVVGSYQRDLKNEEFQVWKLTKNEDDSALIICTDGNDRELKRQRIEWTDFPCSEATVWVEFGTCLLPSER